MSYTEEQIDAIYNFKVQAWESYYEAGMHREISYQENFEQLQAHAKMRALIPNGSINWSPLRDRAQSIVSPDSHKYNVIQIS